MSETYQHDGLRGTLTLTPYILKTNPPRAGGPTYRIPAELGRLLVPEKRTNSDSRLIELAFVRLKSTAERPGPPLIFLAGGPGSSGIEAFRSARLQSWLAALREVGDVIALDQRGTGMSVPCLDSCEMLDIPLDRPGNRDEILEIYRQKSRASMAFWQERSVDLSGYTTEESADDIDALRRALGYEQVHLYGASYGSHLALATVRRHRNALARVMVGMVEGPDHTIKLPSNIQQHLEHINRLVQQDSRLHQVIPDLLDMMRSVMERLERDPVMVAVKNKSTGKVDNVYIGSFDLQYLTAIGVASRRSIAYLPSRYHAMIQGDFSWLAGEVLAWRCDWFGSAMTFHMDSASGASPERLAQIQREAPTTLLGDTIDFPFPWIGDAWGNPDLGAAFRAPIQSDIATLFISGTLDGRTPPSNAEEVRRGFSNNYHIIVEGAAHSTPDQVNVPNVRAAMIDFLQGKPVTITHASTPFEFVPVEV
ncbi:MAG: Pimeloyl-ACP methyl ester carboxylesterase [Chloroflexi bacterium AL-N10]|nr:Pimeloyl-ACP methyl ester carboxylesterase [Chloroflexi bacterium AL-N1]NOK70410.1 Pimeloyl-ACP methyl ester carboxylesterase [Chloroflexi bacterium AL-N10]NOK78088.1 Pimeloyl-ACP methyl ester carboxylesterase [Chloroflexi bacterium AL-N5]NOK92176.1 Pimeloyl-ACP methyl ester carboxylesterase [Chloroflexi bacterium AL-N15]